MFAKFAECMAELGHEPWQRATLLIYPTGTVTCTGVTGDRKKDLFYTIFIHWIMRAHHSRVRRAGPVVALPTSVPWAPYPHTYNMVYSATLRGKGDERVTVCLADYYRSNPILKRYQPRVFPGMPIVLDGTNMTAVVHDSCNVHVAHARSLAAALWFVSVIAEESAPFIVHHREKDSRARNVQRLSEYAAVTTWMSYKTIPQHVQNSLVKRRAERDALLAERREWRPLIVMPAPPPPLPGVGDIDPPPRPNVDGASTTRGKRNTAILSEAGGSSNKRKRGPAMQDPDAGSYVTSHDDSENDLPSSSVPRPKRARRGEVHPRGVDNTTVTAAVVSSAGSMGLSVGRRELQQWRGNVQKSGVPTVLVTSAAAEDTL
jgi:TATA-box binding protein (TBP) (component of TFIID and TFIIIB)